MSVIPRIELFLKEDKALFIFQINGVDATSLTYQGGMVKLAAITENSFFTKEEFGAALKDALVWRDIVQGNFKPDKVAPLNPFLFRMEKTVDGLVFVLKIEDKRIMKITYDHPSGRISIRKRPEKKITWAEFVFLYDKFIIFERQVLNFIEGA